MATAIIGIIIRFGYGNNRIIIGFYFGNWRFQGIWLSNEQIFFLIYWLSLTVMTSFSFRKSAYYAMAKWSRCPAPEEDRGLWRSPHDQSSEWGKSVARASQYLDCDGTCSHLLANKINLDLFSVVNRRSFPGAFWQKPLESLSGKNEWITQGFADAAEETGFIRP